MMMILILMKGVGRVEKVDTGRTSAKGELEMRLQDLIQARPKEGACQPSTEEYAKGKLQWQPHDTGAGDRSRGEPQRVDRRLSTIRSAMSYGGCASRGLPFSFPYEAASLSTCRRNSNTAA
eukprot:TRINITY_DN24165_c0_g1_i4.p1 TRINITY_DN24165_c0_g1~~TRINITY_DN24165_c0_g1_i4.p1  ORF type:complete len:121 (+),score=5.75 TRINITY_DN24165_c0_g1_i4:3-365(+)